MGVYSLKNIIFLLTMLLLLWLSCMESTGNARRVGSHWRQNSIRRSASLSKKKDRKHGSNYLHHGHAGISAHSPKASPPPALAPPLPLVPPPTGGHKTSPPPTTPPPPPVHLPPPTGAHKGIHQPPAAQPPILTPPLAPPPTGGHKGSPPPPNKGEKPPLSGWIRICARNTILKHSGIRSPTPDHH